MDIYRLTSREQRILAYLEFSADRSGTDVAKATKIPIHTVQYVLRRLLDRQVIVRRPIIDLDSLGLAVYGIFLSFSATKNSGTTEFTQLLRKMSSVQSYAHYSGEYQHGIGIAASSPAQAMELLTQIVAQSRMTIVRKSLAVRSSYHYLPHLFPGISGPRREVLLHARAERRRSLSENEYQVLRSLVDMPHESYRGMAQKIGMPSSTFDLQLRSLKNQKVLLASTYFINADALGREAYKLLLRCRVVSSELTAKLQQLLLGIPGIYYMMRCLGEWDYEINLHTASSRELRSIEEQIITCFPQEIDEIRSLAIVDVPIFNPLPMTLEAAAREN